MPYFDCRRSVRKGVETKRYCFYCHISSQRGELSRGVFKAIASEV